MHLLQKCAFLFCSKTNQLATIHFRLCSQSSALKPEHVGAALRDDQCSTKVTELFGYDGESVPNPTGVVTKPTTSCLVDNWGICCQDRHQGKAQVAEGNLYHRLKELRYERRHYPVLAQLQIGDRSEYHLICDTYGGTGWKKVHFLGSNGGYIR